MYVDGMCQCNKCTDFEIESSKGQGGNAKTYPEIIAELYEELDFDELNNEICDVLGIDNDLNED